MIWVIVALSFLAGVAVGVLGTALYSICKLLALKRQIEMPRPQSIDLVQPMDRSELWRRGIPPI